MNRKGFVALLAGLVGLVMVAAPAGAAAPAVLGELPANSQVVVVTQPLSQLSGKVDMFARSAGLPVSPDQPVKVEYMLGAEMGIAGQLDASRGLALAIGNVVDDPEGTMVAFIPVNNAVAAIEAMGAEPAPGQAGVFMLPDPDMFTYLMPAGKHLLLGSSPQSMRAAAAGPKGIRLSAADQELFANSEVAAWIDLRSVMPKARTELMAAIAENEDLAAHPSFQKLATDAVNRLGEVQMASGGLRITAEGLRLTLRGQGAAGSELAEYLSGHAMADTSMISKLPAGPYIMAFAGQFDSKLLLGPLDALATAVKADPTFGAQL